MAIKQTIWDLDKKEALKASKNITEKELEDLIDNDINFLSDAWLKIGRQVRTQHGGLIDLLCLNSSGNPVVVELKRNMTPREVTAQALDYASWAKSLNAESIAKIYHDHSPYESLNDAFKSRFGVELSEDNDDKDIQIVIVGTEMDGSTERIISFLQEYGIDINVLFFNLFEHDGKRLLSRAWMFEPEQISKTSEPSKVPWNGEYYFSFGDEEQRSWADALKYGFVSGGGGSWYSNTMRMLEVGDRIWVNIPRTGYVGVGTVEEVAKPAQETIIQTEEGPKSFYNLDLHANYNKNALPGNEEFVILVDWQKKVALAEAVREYGFFGNQNTVCKPKTDKWNFTVNRLKEIWDIDK